MLDGNLLRAVRDIRIGVVNQFMGRMWAPAKTRSASTKTRTPIHPKKTAKTTTAKTTEPSQSPIQTFGTIRYSAIKYNAPQMLITEERRIRFNEEMKKEAQAEEEKKKAAIRTYEADLERLKLQKSEFGVLSGGFGPTSQCVKSAVEKWEREHRSLMSSLKTPAARPAGQQSQIKTCSN